MKKYLIIILIAVSVAIINKSAYANESNILGFNKINEEHRTLSSAIGISVNSKEEVALAFKDGYINVYGSNGQFINGYSFNIIGSYVFKYDESDNIMVFPIRASACYFFDTNAKLIKTIKISNQSEKDKYYRALEDNNTININGQYYKLSQSIGYTKLTKTDTNRNVIIIYDIGYDYLGKIFKGMFFLIFAIISLLAIKRAFK